MAVIFRQIGAPRTDLIPGETHVYCSPLDDPMPLRALLNADEQARAARFRLARARDQFVIARGWLRTLLGSYLGIDPRAIEFLYADSGKPYLSPDCALYFNVSHSDALAVFALSRSRVGVDVERQRLIPDADNLVNRFFSPWECAEFEALPATARPAAFLRAWTRKEAVLKAIGRGARSLDCCEVTFVDGEAPKLRQLDGDVSACERWDLSAWEPAAGYVAAIAIERPSRKPQ